MTTKKFNPPTDDLYRVYRGGSWIVTSATFVRAAFRVVNTPMYRDYYIGFRLTQTGCRQSVDRA